MCQCWLKFVCAAVVLLTLNSVSCVPYKNPLKRFVDYSLTEKRNHIENCILQMNYTCLEKIVRSHVNEFLDKDEYELMDNVVIEKVSDNSSDAKSSSNSRTKKKIGLYRKVRDFFSNRALRLDFMDVLRLRMSRAATFPEEVELSLEVVPEEGTTKVNVNGGKGHRTAKIVVPLVIGFILTGLGILAIAAVKAILMKAFFVSTVAALAAVFLVIKKALANQHMSSHDQSAPIYFAQYPIPYDTAYHPAEHQTPYNALSHYATINPTDQAWAAPYSSADTSYGGYSVTEHDSGAAAGGEASDEDSHGHFSNNRPQVVPQPTVAVKIRRKSGVAGPFRGMIKLVKSQANRLPVLAYRHTGTGRRLA